MFLIIVYVILSAPGAVSLLVLYVALSSFSVYGVSVSSEVLLAMSITFSLCCKSLCCVFIVSRGS